jgi:hypothetical protein
MFAIPTSAGGGSRTAVGKRSSTLARFLKRGEHMHCPSLNVFGTFFPAWMLCALIGIGGAIVAFKVVSALHASGFVRVPLIFYPCVALAITSLVWLGWYGR